MISLLHPDAEFLQQNHSPRSLKVAVIREEFVALTGDPLIAVVLNQLLYWTQRVKDFDQLLEEEIKRNPECNVPLRHGWLYKSADELSAETMIRLSRSTVRRYLSFLINKRWIDERHNPDNKWNKTTQYRLNLSKLQDDLLALGYCLPGFSLPVNKDAPNLQKPRETPNGQNETSKEQNETSMFQNDRSNVTNCSSIYLNRDYPETKNREHTQNARADNKFLMEELAPQVGLEASAISTENEGNSHIERQWSFPRQAVEIWKRCVGQEKLHLTDTRTRQLTFLLNKYFQNDLCAWEKFCRRIKASTYLMGQGANKWHVSFNWILDEENILKVLEGNFDKPKILEQSHQQKTHKNRDMEIREILDSIEDDQWKYWCTQLSRSFSQKDNPPHKETFANDSLSLGDLKDIAQARFLEFDGRLVWIESSYPKTLSRIEDLRLIILPVIRHTYPQARNVRTQREERGRGKTGALSSIHVDADKINIRPHQNSEKGDLTSHFPCGQEQDLLSKGNLTSSFASLSNFKLNKREPHVKFLHTGNREGGDVSSPPDENCSQTYPLVGDFGPPLLHP